MSCAIPRQFWPVGVFVQQENMANVALTALRARKMNRAVPKEGSPECRPA